MSEAAHHLIDAFMALPVSERHAVLLELARISELNAGPISNEELTFAGQQVFAMYDSEESENANTNKR